jgi:hypothetical protein
MTAWKLTAAKLVATIGLLIAGIGVSAAWADPGNGNGNGPPTTVPGSPGDDCSHGNSDKDCRPDPNENGKDCEDHGNARGNEDHCDSGGTTTTTTTTETTTTTTTTDTTPTTTTTATTTPSTTTTATPQGNSTPSSSGESSSTSAPPITKPAPQKERAQVKGAQAASPAHAAGKPGELPFTGLPTWAFALIGSVLLGAGLGLRKVAA